MIGDMIGGGTYFITKSGRLLLSDKAGNISPKNISPLVKILTNSMYYYIYPQFDNASVRSFPTPYIKGPICVLKSKMKPNKIQPHLFNIVDNYWVRNLYYPIRYRIVKINDGKFLGYRYCSDEKILDNYSMDRILRCEFFEEDGARLRI